MTDFIWDNFGLLEFILGTELVILMAAAFFYQVAKIIAKTDRHDPLVRFYRVFWLSFFAPVSSIKELEMRQAEYAARAAGMAGMGSPTQEQLTNLDAPDLVDLDAATASPPPLAGEDEPPQSNIAPIGRTGGEHDPRLRTGPPAGPSRELQFAQRNSPEERAADREAAIPVSRHRDVTAPPSGPSSGQTAATSTFDACINPFQPAARITGVRDGEVMIDVTCAPEDGQANGAIITLMAQRLNVRPYQIVLLRGHYKMRKTLQVAGIDQQTLSTRIASI